ncbi:glycosyltransferase [Litorihabitans aurantiacus]|uniref:D-inositol 3-phosphate glycosyltransferase n=1 Tax=Litorihabitans aurantiacus TaxID=1930061 RepID=A0AA37XG87_9MICO|nr:glycosyltransferase [Litorihabitans aurantiacus]GMA32714.1 hypothetical protein GCM10025875_27060 [Litorihabitans aurantiacus]
MNRLSRRGPGVRSVLVTGTALVAATLAALAGTALVGDRVWAVVTASLLLATTAVALLGVRELRRRLVVDERRLRLLERHLPLGVAAASPAALAAGAGASGQDTTPEALRRVQDLERELAVSLALLDLRRPGSDGRVGAPALSREAASSAALTLLERGDVLDADDLVARHHLGEDLPLAARRTLARGLRARGFHERAMRHFRSAAAVGTARDVEQLALREAEVDVLAGRFVPTLAPRTPGPSVVGRVLHVVGRAVPDTQSGYTLRTQSTARAQAEAGMEPHVFVQLGITRATVPTVDDVDGVLYHRPVGGSVFTVGHRAWLQENAEALLETVLRVRPEVLHAHSDYVNAVLATAVGRATGTPVVYEARGFWEETWLSRAAATHGWRDVAALTGCYGVPEAYRWRRDREAQARAGADATVTLARTMLGRITEAGLPGSGVTIVPNAVDVDRFSRARRDPALAARLGIPPDAVVIGSITSVVEYEGLDVLVDAFARLTEESVNPVRLLVVGDGPVLADLRTRVADLGLADAILTGRVAHEDVVAYYGLIDVFVVPRRDVEVCHLVTP